jgi:Ca2+/Na+ antiporter
MIYRGIILKKRILDYMDYVDHALENNDTGLTYGQLLEEHKEQLKFFMHERLVHLLVTLTFAILTFGTFFMLMLDFSIGLLILLALFLVLLIPYIMHYYLLENSVQKMYRQYDELLKMVIRKEQSKS